MSIKARLAEVQQAIERHAAGRPVTLVAVTKYASVGRMREAYGAGVRHFGENKVQDALMKMDAFPATEYPDLRWHFIGNLQTNKVKKTVGRFECLHAVDSPRLAAAVSEASVSQGLRQKILIQINLTEDPARHGILPDQAPSIIEACLALQGIDLRGLMAMAPAEASLNGDSAALKRVFRTLRDMRDRFQRDFEIDLPDLSMGMSHDFPQALECGATIIRIGNFLFKS